MEIESLLALPGEGDTRTKTEVRRRRICEHCDNPAQFMHTFLLPNARNNPASTGYLKDDISWCDDARSFVCAQHDREREMPGYQWTSTFSACDRFAHMFLVWQEA